MTGCTLLHLPGSPPAALPPYQLVSTGACSAGLECFENPHRSLIEACAEHTSGKVGILQLILGYYGRPRHCAGIPTKSTVNLMSAV
ncbi:hypothetical protein SAMD00023353_1701560 [Rosellinia necatrix]|uniref:Uncharacterized protein n=1 Tax=Rosellinia necatrix TaxID=77044 RepID=A0A1S8A7B7_ROSNE|nr:hypothetical protein SAMD00023353_1701560 [Rosellinia necatrix]